MAKLEKLRDEIAQLYLGKQPERGAWADWLYPNHVLMVAKLAEQIAAEHKADIDQSVAAALLHDISDAVMSRFAPGAEQRSLEIAEELLLKCGFSEDDVQVIVYDAIKNHSCRDGKLPDTLPGKILATADALAHFNTDFYLFAAHGFGSDRTYDEYISWLDRKIEKDYHVRLAFEDTKKATTGRYKFFKELVSGAQAGQQR